MLVDFQKKPIPICQKLGIKFEQPISVILFTTRQPLTTPTNKNNTKELYESPHDFFYQSRSRQTTMETTAVQETMPATEMMPATETMPTTETTTETVPALMVMPTTRIHRHEDATPSGDTPPNWMPKVMSPEMGRAGVGSGDGDPVLNPNPNLNFNPNPISNP